MTRRDRARPGRGRRGGAGRPGKTAWLGEFAQNLPGARLLRGTCEPLATPVPLGPLRDLADELPDALRRELAGGHNPAEVRRLLLHELRANDTPTLVVLDDAHWADEATLDLLRFLGRRIATCPAMVVVTYRQDEVSARHPLRVLAGDLATLPVVRRLTVPLMSRRVVDAAADMAAIVDSFGLETLPVFGVSGGGPHALAFAANHPDRVTKVATLASTAPRDAAGLDWTASMMQDNRSSAAAAERGRETLATHLATAEVTAE